MGVEADKRTKILVSIDKDFAEFIRDLAYEDRRTLSTFVVESLAKVHGKRVPKRKRRPRPMSTAS